MTQEQRAECRAQGALDNMLYSMRAALEREGRSDEYKAAFWDNLKNVMADYANK